MQSCWPCMEMLNNRPTSTLNRLAQGLTGDQGAELARSGENQRPWRRKLNGLWMGLSSEDAQVWRQRGNCPEKPEPKDPSGLMLTVSRLNVPCAMSRAVPSGELGNALERAGCWGHGATPSGLFSQLRAVSHFKHGELAHEWPIALLNSRRVFIAVKATQFAVAVVIGRQQGQWQVNGSCTWRQRSRLQASYVPDKHLSDSFGARECEMQRTRTTS